MAKSPNDEPAPTRPTWGMLLIAVGALLIAEAAYHWSDISAAAKLPEIEHYLGMK